MKPTRLKDRLKGIEVVLETLIKEVQELQEVADEHDYLENNIILCQAKICEYVQELDDAAKAQRIVAELNNLLEREK